MQNTDVAGQKNLTWDDVPGIVASIEQPVIPDRVYEISEYGAVADGETDVWPIITSVISEANKSGGGKIVIEEGIWYVKGPIHLLSYIELHLVKGAQLKFSGDSSHYLPQVLTRWEGTELYNY